MYWYVVRSVISNCFIDVNWLVLGGFNMIYLFFYFGFGIDKGCVFIFCDDFVIGVYS